MDLGFEISQLIQNIFLTIALGKDISDMEIDYWDDGSLVKRTFISALNDTFNNLALRQLNHPQFLLFPNSSDWYLTLEHRQYLHNAIDLRQIINEVIIKRELELKKPNKQGGADIIIYKFIQL